jgi:hypothetical protein
LHEELQQLMNVKSVKSTGLPLVLLLATLPGAVSAAAGDWLKQQFLISMAGSQPQAPIPPTWVVVPLSEYYLVGVLLGFFILTGIDGLFRLSPAACRAYTSSKERKWGRIVRGGALGGAFVAGWLILSYFTGIGSDSIILGFGPAVAVYWWLKRRGDWPVADNGDTRQGDIHH